MAKLQSGGRESTVRVLFQLTVSVKVKETWNVNSSIEEKYMVCITISIDEDSQRSTWKGAAQTS